jgi:signal peptidase I
MALVMPGSAHVISRRWKNGMLWLIGLVVLASLNFFVSSIPVSLSFATFIVTQILTGSLYVIYYVSLLISSYRLTTPRLGYCGWFLFLLAVLTFYTAANDFLSLVLRTHIGRHDKIKRWDMYPTLQPEASGTSHWGDKTMLSMLSYRFSDPRRGDIVGFEMRERQWWQQPQHVSRRVVGLPGETIDIQYPYVLINGEKLVDP